MTVPRVIVFASGKDDAVADGVRENLRREHAGRRFEVDVWKDGYFNENMTQPLNTFLKRLLCYDVAVLILGATDLRKAAGEPRMEWVPRDNVIFELGAAMARMGIKKTFVLTPEGGKVVLPSYFDGLTLLTYERRRDGNNVAGAGAACATIRGQLGRLDGDVYHSDLPAIGLAHGYFYNFVNAVYATLREAQTLPFRSGPQEWKPAHGFRLIVAIPNAMLNREAADRLLTGKIGAENVGLRLRDGRDVSVYALPRTPEGILDIVDIPTTLLTSADVIDRVDQFWGAGDTAFKNDLARRERDAFQRRLVELRDKAKLDPKRVRIVPQGKVASLLRERSG